MPDLDRAAARREHANQMRGVRPATLDRGLERVSFRLLKGHRHRRAFLQSAQSLAMRDGHQQFSSLHMLKVLLDDSEGLAGGLIDRAGGNSRGILKATEDALKKLPKVSGSGAGQIYLAPDMARAIGAAEKVAEKAGDGFITVERLLLGLTLEKGSEAGSILSKGGVTPQNLAAPRTIPC